MAEQDALSSFDFNKFGGSGLFVKFRADIPLTLRILTTDPVISETEFTDKKTGEVNISTRFAFIVYNFTEERAQILQASPAMARKIGELHVDPDFGANIRKIDIKITPTGEGLERRYDIQVLPNARTLTAAQVAEAQEIDLDDKVKDSKGRMSRWDQTGSTPAAAAAGSGYDKAKAAASKLKKDDAPAEDDAPAPGTEDIVIEDIGDEPINLDDMPF
jgi:hypothetical protein